MKNKVFIGLVDIASFIDDFAEGFNRNGIKTLKGSLLLQTPTQSSVLDFCVQKTKNRVGYFKPGRISVYFKPWYNKKVEDYYFKKTVRECDVFFFIWSSFKTDFSDYLYLKEKGKKIITFLVGSDVRWPFSMRQDFIEVGLPVVEDFHYAHADYSVKDLERCLQSLRMAEKYSDVILGHPNFMQLALRSYTNINIPIIANKFEHKPEQRKIPVLVHAPTSTIKGTLFIEEVIQRLKNEGLSFEYIRIQNMPREKALEVYADADIILDQLLLPGGGKLAHEGLAMGKIVLTLMGYGNYDQQKTLDCPLIDVNPDTLYDVLKDLILDYVKRIELAKKGRQYIVKYHDPKTVTKQILDLLNNPSEKSADFIPNFFNNKFIPESEEATKMYNKWTDVVKDCDWYKKEVKPGARAGLMF